MATNVKIKILGCDRISVGQIIVSDPSSAITSGGTYFFVSTNPQIKSMCYTVTSVPLIEVSGPDATFSGPYTDCIDCISNNSPYVTLSNCDGSQGLYTFNVSDFTSGITTGDTFYMNFTWNGKRLVGCYYIVDFSFTPPQELSILNEIPISELSCTDCLINNSNILYLTSCDRPGDLYPFNIGDLPSGTTTGDTFYIDFTYFEKQLNGCFYVADFGFDIPIEISVLINQSGQTDCATCYANNPFIYSVSSCISGVIVYVSLPNDNYVNHLITYFDIITNEQFCGVVVEISNTTPDVTFIADLVEYLDPQQCEDCVDQVADKKIITNCLTNSDEVVWASTLFEYGSSSNLSGDDGCFLVGDLTTSAVTLNSFLNFDPQPDCQSCIQCFGVNYVYSSCTNTGPIVLIESSYSGSGITEGLYGPFTGVTDNDGYGASFYVVFDAASAFTTTTIYQYGVRYGVDDTIIIDGSSFGGISGIDDITITVTEVTNTGTFTSYQYVNNSIGTTLYNPWLNDCVEITDYSEGTGLSPINSFNSSLNCEQCLTTDNFVWVGYNCDSGGVGIITTSNGFTTGDYVKVKYGTSDFQCFYLDTPYETYMGNYDVWNSLDTSPYDTCEECSLNTRIGISISECDGSNQEYVSVTLQDWYTLTGYYETPQNVFNLEHYGKCYRLINSCPLEIDRSFREITPLTFYYNCLECYNDNTRFPRNAGPETLFCMEVCGPSGTTVTQVSPPHPVWTDAYGTAVTQLNMITLGGPDGLNN